MLEAGESERIARDWFSLEQDPDSWARATYYSIFGHFRGMRSALSDATLRFDLAPGVRRRHAPKSCQK